MSDNGVVHVIINPKTGERQMEVKGVKGAFCSDVIEALNRNHEVLDEGLTEEWYEATVRPDYVENM